MNAREVLWWPSYNPRLNNKRWQGKEGTQDFLHFVHMDRIPISNALLMFSQLSMGGGAKAFLCVKGHLMRTLGVHVCILAHVDHGEPVEIRGHLLRVGSLQPCKFQKFHSGGRAWRQVPSPEEPRSMLYF